MTRFGLSLMACHVNITLTLVTGKEKHREQMQHKQTIYINAKIDCWIIYPAAVLSDGLASHDIKFTIYVKLRIINISEEYYAGHRHMSIER